MMDRLLENPETVRAMMLANPEVCIAAMRRCSLTPVPKQRVHRAHPITLFFVLGHA
jgi:hypothetical protein